MSDTDLAERRDLLAITGAAGYVGRHVVPLLRAEWHLRLIDIEVVAAASTDEVTSCDVGDLPALTAALSGVSAVLHLAAVAGDGDFVGEVVPKNIIGAYNVFEAARRAGVATIVFASSGQVVLGYGRDTFVTADLPVRPIGPYAASKLFGEALGRYYHDAYGLRVFALRMGWFGPEFSDEMKADPRGWCWGEFS